jgi:hypothetical protein
MVRTLASIVGHLAFDDARVGTLASWRQLIVEDLGHHPLA